MIKVAVLGCGVIGVQHAALLGAHPAYTVVAVIDPKSESTAKAAAAAVERAGEAGHDQQAPAAYETLTEALAAGGIDLVSICTPSGRHAAQAEECIRAGVHTVIEKPLDITVPRGRALLEVEATHAQPGQVISVISQHRFDPAHQVTKTAIDQGRLGSVTSAVASMAWYRTQEYYDGGDWRGTWELDGGGAVMNQAVHTVDLLRWYLGEPVQVSAQAGLLAHERIEVEDVLTATISFASGALAVLHASTAAYPGLTTRIQVHGTAGSSIVDRDQLDYFFSAVDASGAEGARAEGGSTTEVKAAANAAEAMVPAEHLRSNPPETGTFAKAHSRQFDDIAEAISQGRPPGVTLTEAHLSLALVRALYTSASLGQPVLFADVLDGAYDDTVTRFSSTPTRQGS
ncbi:Gfo/Idh/MocA family protein [Propionibacteriaceae bacterium Y1685]|uniref:Gfo/Idh/MocA family protein n=1 Tax=Microlunatus sp. Y1700 TaxID=3418487 RepID=UPI003B7945D6